MVESTLAEMHAIRTGQPMALDGRLGDAVWREAPAYALGLSGDRVAQGASLQEPGTVQLAYDDDYLYAGFRFADSDVVQESGQDQQHHYATGDVAELFLKPAEATWYWELYATPNARRTAFFFPGGGRLGLPSVFEPCLPGLRVAAQVQGTLNDWRRRDEGWTAEMAVPLAELAAMGVPLDREHAWRVLVGRYNYSCHLPKPELSMHPRLSATDFHLTEQYAQLILVP